jgi:hypothetical protein
VEDAMSKNDTSAELVLSGSPGSARHVPKANPPETPESIPEVLRSLRRWVTWGYFDYGEKKLRKVPMVPAANRTMKGWDDSGKWRSFDEVIAEATSRPGVGIGFVFDESDRIIGIDLDDAYDENGDLKPWVREIGEQFSATYCERTPSGAGLHYIGYGDRIEGKTSKKFEDGSGAVERYSQSRWFTFTGDVVVDHDVVDVQPAMAWLAAKYFPDAVKSKPAAALSRSHDDDPDLDVALARVCVDRLSPGRSSDADDWRNVGYALKATSESLLDTWLEFSRRWPGCDEAECLDRWNRFEPRCSLGTLVHMATTDSGLTAVQLRDEARERIGREPWRPTRSRVEAATGEALAVVGEIVHYRPVRTRTLGNLTVEMRWTVNDKHAVRILDGERVLEMDEFNVSLLARREKFAKTVAKQTGQDAAELGRMLIAMLEEGCPPLPATPKPNEASRVPIAVECTVEIDGRPAVLVGGAGLVRSDALDRCQAIVGAEFYQADEALVSVDVCSNRGAHVVRRITLERLAAWLDANVAFFVLDPDTGERRVVACPQWLSRRLFSLQRFDSVRPVNGIATGPFMRHDGSIGGYVSGYDDQTGVVVATKETWAEIPERPSRGRLLCSWRRPP